MRKGELERARRCGPSWGVNADQLQVKIVKDLDVVRGAYEVAAQLMEQIRLLAGQVQREDKPTRAVRDLSAAMRDTAVTLVALREEGRETVRSAVKQAEAVAEMQQHDALPAADEPPEK